MSEIDRHNLIETKALIASLAEDREEMEVQVDSLSAHELRVYAAALERLIDYVYEAHG